MGSKRAVASSLSCLARLSAAAPQPPRVSAALLSTFIHPARTASPREQPQTTTTNTNTDTSRSAATPHPQWRPPQHSQRRNLSTSPPAQRNWNLDSGLDRTRVTREPYPLSPTKIVGPASAPASADPLDPTRQLAGDRAAHIQPRYELTFTCAPCGERSRHHVSKQGYHHGSVLIACPGCRNRHVISDHLGVFGDKGATVEDIMRERGTLVKRGTLGEDGDIEFWEDGSTTARAERDKDVPLPPQPKSRDAAADESVPGSTFASVRPEGKDGQ